MGIEIRKNLQTLTPYPPGKPIEDVKREFNLDKVIKLASNENPLGPSPKALEAIKNHLPEINLYPDGNVYYLKQPLAEKLGVSPDNLIFGNGTDELIILISQTYLDPGDEIIVSDMGFIRYQMAAQVQNAQWVAVPMIDFRHDLKGFANAVTPRTKIIFFSNPTNPLGSMVTAAEVDELIRSVSKDVLIVIDEAYYEYVDDPDYPATMQYLEDFENLVILRTFSKAYGLAGLRIGYGIGNPCVINDINRVRPPFNVNRLAQEAALAAITDHDHIERSRQLNKEGLAYLCRKLDQIGIDYVQPFANFVCIDVGIDCMKVFDDLQRMGIIIRPMKGYGLETHIRVTAGTMEQNREFIAALTEVL